MMNIQTRMIEDDYLKVVDENLRLSKENAELVGALRLARNTLDSIRGAVESNQVVDKDVHGLSVARRNEFDTIISKHGGRDA